MGLEMPCLYTSQISEHVECLIRHGGTDTITGQLLDGMIEVAKAEIGTAGDLFSLDYDIYSLLVTDGWIKHVWREIQEMNLQVRERTDSLILKRQQDSFIMDTFQRNGFSEEQIGLLNMVRIFVQVTTLSDMASGDGHYLLPFINESVNPIAHFSSVNWPNQGQPPPKAWRLWRQALKKCFPHSKDLRLDHLLGPWIRKDKKWGAFWDQHNHSLYIYHDDCWHRYQKDNDIMTQQRTRFREVGTTPPPSDCSHLAVAWVANNEICFRGIGRWQPNGELTTKSWASEWLEEANPSTLTHIGEAISQGEAIAMTDGSFANRMGTAGFCISHSLKCTVRGACRVPGPMQVQIPIKVNLREYMQQFG